jgi:sigma-E factor negative regulatory protein RseA
MTNEQLSEWLDDELGGSQSGRVMQDVLRQPQQRETCAVYWLIGDCLRGEPATMANGLSSRVMAALENEPTVLAPPRRAAEPQYNRWMPVAAAVAGFAVAVGMAMSVWTGASTQGGGDMARKAGPASQVASVSTQPQEVSGDRDYLMAHQASSMGEPMAGVAQYIRTVSDEQTGGR